MRRSKGDMPNQSALESRLPDNGVFPAIVPEMICVTSAQFDASGARQTIVLGRTGT